MKEKEAQRKKSAEERKKEREGRGGVDMPPEEEVQRAHTRTVSSAAFLHSFQRFPLFPFVATLAQKEENSGPAFLRHHGGVPLPLQVQQRPAPPLRAPLPAGGGGR